MAKPSNHYFGKAFHRKDGDTQRSVLSFDKWDADNKKNIKPKFIEYEDGSRYEFLDGPVTFKLMDKPNGNHYANVYQTEWVDGGEDGIPF